MMIDANTDSYGRRRYPLPLLCAAPKLRPDHSVGD